MSTAMMRPAPGQPRALDGVQPDRAAADHGDARRPARRAPCASTAPTPVITPQPMRQARSNGHSPAPGSRRTRHDADSAMRRDDQKWCTGSPPRVMRGRCRRAARPCGWCRRERLAQDRLAAVAVEAVAAVRVPRADHVVAGLHARDARGPPPRPCRRPRGRAPWAADRRASPGSPRGRCGRGPWRGCAPARRPAAARQLERLDRERLADAGQDRGPEPHAAPSGSAFGSL